MKRNGLVIIGAGGMGREVLSLLDTTSVENGSCLEPLGFIDDGDPDEARLERIGLPLLGSVADLLLMSPRPRYVVGIGDRIARSRIDRQLVQAGFIAASVHHRTSSVGRDVHLEPGSVLCGGSIITTNVRAGRHLLLNVCATISHDCTVGDYVTVSPGVNISGDVTVGDRVLFGANCSVLPGVSIGDDARIGAGAVVTKDVAPGSTVMGVPAKPR